MVGTPVVKDLPDGAQTVCLAETHLTLVVWSGNQATRHARRVVPFLFLSGGKPLLDGDLIWERKLLLAACISSLLLFLDLDLSPCTL